VNRRCEMCDGTGEGSGGWKGICGYCDGTGEGACSECQYPSSDRDPPSGCMNHGPTQQGLDNARSLREDRRTSGSRR
jgi:hypothetical protein